MKILYYLGLLGLMLFEVLNVYFIMPMPGSQTMDSLGLAYFFYSWRWVFRGLFVLMAALGSRAAFGQRPLISISVLVLVGAVTYLFNFRMSADHMFLKANHVITAAAHQNQLPPDRLVIGVEWNGEAKAYPISVIEYHHQIMDTIGGRPVLITYCSVCRTGRVYQPMVNGQPEQFRLVGMNYFNAMFEDERTKSWWRQSTGEAVAGPLKGAVLSTVHSIQTTVGNWYALHPNGEVMQPDPDFLSAYDPEARYEKGLSRGSLTRTDSLDWKPKSWVVGVEIGSESKAYSWRQLAAERIINDQIGNTPLCLVLGLDGQSFAAFERPTSAEIILQIDTLVADGLRYDMSGRCLSDSTRHLRSIQANQEFYHGWVTFHPSSTKYE